MLPLVFAVAPAIYAWSKAGVGEALLVAGVAYATFVVYAWIQSRRVQAIDIMFDTLRNDLKRKVILSQIIVPSVVGWPLAWFLVND